MRIGILETGEVAEELRARHGDYPAMFRQLLSAVDPALEFATVRVVAGEMPVAPGQADAWLVTGSRHGVYDDLPWIAPLKAFLRDCVARHVPVVGICFGHQILAEALGGRAAKSDRGWGLGVQEYDFVARPGWMADAPAHFAMRALHQDQVVAPPEGATVLAKSRFCDYAALAYGDPEAPDAISLQPHPEFGPDFMAELLALRSGKAIPAADVDAARPGLGQPVASADWAKWIVAYLRRAEAARAAA